MEGTTTAWRTRVGELRASGTAQAGVLAVATMAQQVMAVVFTVIFTRVLGTDGYGSLAALLNLTVILLVPGSALQVAAAREGTLGRRGVGGELARTLNRWERHLLLGTLGLAAVCVLGREPLSDLVNVEEEWAAAAVPVSGALWLLVSVQRGLLQSARAYVPVALSIVLEGMGRILGAVVLVTAGLGVTGAYLGTMAAFACAAIALHVVLRRRLGAPARTAPPHPLRRLARDAAIPIAGLVLVAALQNVDVIMAKHALSEDDAGVYAATTVAAKLVVWVAFGIGLWVVPEATGAAAAGRDPRRVLARALGLILLVAIPALAIFAAVPGLLLGTAFGAEYERGDEILLVLGAAYALLAMSLLCVQFMLGLHRRAFVLALAVASAAEPVLLLGADSLGSFAGTVLAVQGAAALAMLGLAVGVKTSRARVSSADAVA
jgi:O-antigen/teichoic acid export membrane protein